MTATRQRCCLSSAFLAAASIVFLFFLSRLSTRLSLRAPDTRRLATSFTCLTSGWLLGSSLFFAAASFSTCANASRPISTSPLRLTSMHLDLLVMGTVSRCVRYTTPAPAVVVASTTCQVLNLLRLVVACVPAVACPLFPMKRWYEGLGATMTSDDDGVHANDLASDLWVCLCICCWLDVDVARLLTKCVECWPIAALFEPATPTEVAEKSLPEAHAAYAAYAKRIPEGRTVGIIITSVVVVSILRAES
mmetsp:Transcript_3093/g.7976  ORF Transcript_3093/g.7976 Transcript_3093/m.7976 type:complete len:249 (+) Transcript_3093:615-1361(+)